MSRYEVLFVPHNFLVFSCLILFVPLFFLSLSQSLTIIICLQKPTWTKKCHHIFSCRKHRHDEQQETQERFSSLLSILFCNTVCLNTRRNISRREYNEATPTLLVWKETTFSFSCLISSLVPFSFRHSFRQTLSHRWEDTRETKQGKTQGLFLTQQLSQQRIPDTKEKHHL